MGTNMSKQCVLLSPSLGGNFIRIVLFEPKKRLVGCFCLRSIFFARLFARLFACLNSALDIRLLAACKRILRIYYSPDK